MNAWKWLWRYLKPHSAPYFFSYGLVVIFIIVSLSVPWIMGTMVDDVVRGGLTERLWPYILALVGITV